MIARIDLFAPATITTFAGGTNSLDMQPGHGISINDPNGGTITVTLVAANSAASLSASSLGGATIAAQGNTLTVTGLASQVNTALRSLDVFEPTGALSDVISLSAAEPGELAASTAIAVDVAATIGPAFATPPASLSLAAWSLDSIPGLVIGDPQLQSLIAAGEGAQETLQLTLAAASGVLLLPNLSALDGISVTGIGTGTILLTFTGDQLGAVNSLLADLSFAGPAGLSGLAYGLRNLAGPLGSFVTSGNITLNVTGRAGATKTVTSAADTVILGLETVASGTLIVSSITSDLGGIAGGLALQINPDAAFEMPYNTLNLGGTSYDEGSFGALAVNEAGTFFVGGTAVIGNVLNLGGAGVIDVSGTLIGAAAASVAYQEGFSLAAGAEILGDGALIAGNFANAGRIFGPGTIAAASGGTLLIAGAEISGGAHLQVGAGGVLELGPIAPLFGVFDATPLTIDAGITLAFLGENGPDAVTGAFADNLDQRGGVIVINSPDVFAGTIVNFLPGDRLVFPGLSGLTLLSITSHSFVVAGVDGNGDTVDYTINAVYPSGTTPFVYVDNEGDSEVGLRDAQVDVMLGPTLATSGQIVAQPGIAQPIQGLDILLRSWTTQSLTLTLAVSQGILSDGTLTPGAALTLSAASPTALDAALAGLVYTPNANAAQDALRITAASGWLNGLNTAVPISLTGAGGTIAGFGDAGQVALFAGTFGGVLQAAATLGEILVTGTADFADALDVPGLSGTALRIDAGGVALFDAAAAVTLGGGVTAGDAAGAGSLSIFTDDFSVAGGITIDGGGGAYIGGAATISGAMQIGAAAAGNVYVAGSLAASGVSILSFGTLAISGGGDVSAGTLTDAGVLVLTDQAGALAGATSLTGTMVLEGTSAFTVQNGITISNLAIIGPDAYMSAATFNQTAGSLVLDGTLAAASFAGAGTVSLGGGTLVAPVVSLTGATLIGAGDIEAPTSLATILMQAATIEATGSLDVGGNITMTGASAILIAGSAALEAAHTVTGGTVAFTGAGANLTIDDLQAFTAPVGSMLDHDVIDLVGVAPGLVTFAEGAISATDVQGNGLGGFALSAAAGQPPVAIVSDGNGGTLITLGGDMPCFARGTRILTPCGYRPVEALNPGDAVITASGAARPVRWIGYRTLDLARGPEQQPVRVAAGAIGPGIPARPVQLSPLHAVFIGGVLVPALHLVNAATIHRAAGGAVTYYHFELDRHDIVMAEGMPAETFQDNGNRGLLYKERGVRVGRTAPCAPLVTTGPILASIRRALHKIALEAGYRLTYDPALRGIAASTSLLPDLTMRRRRRIARFDLPQGARSLRVVARTASPAETDPDSEDRRQLGVCLSRVSPGVTRGAGWQPQSGADEGNWMTGGAELLLAENLPSATIELAAVVQSWRPPGL